MSLDIFSSDAGTFFNGFIDAASDTRADAGAVSITTFATKVTTTTASAITLADGAKLGQLKLIVMTADTGDATLTPSNFANGTTITFADVGDAVLLLWNGSNWRSVLELNLADGTTAPVIA